jgi:hypothetical protein
MRTMSSVKTRAGLWWDKDWRLIPAKLLVGGAAQDYFAKYGSTGWFTKTNAKRMEQLVGDRIPEALDDIRKEYDGSQPLGSLLARRGSHCVTANLYKHGFDELGRFYAEPIFSPTVDAVRGTGKLTYIKLQQLQQERTRIAFKDKLGLYLRWNHDYPNLIYVGISKDIYARSGGHTNSPLYLFDAFATAKLEDAAHIEAATHQFLLENGEAMHTGTRGLFKVHSGNARDMVLDFLHRYYGKWFRSVGTGEVT